MFLKPLPADKKLFKLFWFKGQIGVLGTQFKLILANFTDEISSRNILQICELQGYLITFDAPATLRSHIFK